MSEGLAGVDGILDQLRQYKERTHKGKRKGTLLALRNVLNVSNRKVPHELGDLERDGGIVYDDSTGVGAVTYGRDADVAKYAVRQHEDLSLNHDREGSAPGRSAKFLENAFNSTRDQSAKIIQEAIRRETGA